MCLTATCVAPRPAKEKGKAMRQTALDSPYDRNQMQTLFAMLTDVRVQTPVAKPKARPAKGRKHLFALWWQKLLAHRLVHSGGGKVPSLRGRTPSPRYLNPRHSNPRHSNPRHSNPQSAASPLVPRKPARWRAPVSDGSVEFFALLDEMGARHQAAARRDHLITALEASISKRCLER